MMKAQPNILKIFSFLISVTITLVQTISVSGDTQLLSSQGARCEQAARFSLFSYN